MYPPSTPFDTHSSNKSCHWLFLLTLVLAKSVRWTPLLVSYSTLSRAYQEPLWPRSWSLLVGPNPSKHDTQKYTPSRRDSTR